MGAVGQRMKLRLFLEGVEVPVIAATVQVVPNAPAACSIQIPPLAEATGFFARTLVHLFFLDPNEVSSPFASPSPMGTAITNTNQSPTQYEVDQFNNISSTSQQDITNSQYKLLFGGEVVGFQWTKNQAQRSIVLQCLDWSNYWDYAYQWNNTDLFGPGIKAMFAGGSTNLFTDFLEDEGSAILRIIQSPSISYPNLKGLLGGIVHLLEAIGGSYYYKTQIAGENIFFTIAELRLHITQMITAFEKDPTASQLLAAGYDSLFGRMLGGLGQQVSIRQAINALMSAIFHETYAIPTPMYVPGSGNTPSGQSTSSVRADPANAFIATTADNLLQGISGIQTQLAQAPSPAIAGSSAAAAAALINSLQQMVATCNQTANQITAPSVLGAKGYYVSASSALSQAQAAAQQWVPGANSSITGKITAGLSTAQQALQSASTFNETTPTNMPVAARLNSQIFRPDVWFTAPPCCNVVFPEQYHTLTYQRKFLEEPTRLLLKTNDEFFGEDELFDSFYFAPKGITIKTGGKDLAAILSNDLLDHELFSGILPVFEKMGELNIFAAESGTVQGPLAKVGPAQRSTNFLYFKYRFAARQLSFSGKFNPWLAPGFPAFIIDKYVDGDALIQRQQLIQQNSGIISNDINNQTLGAHFLCNLTEVTHSLSQQEGGTECNCSYARQPWEGVEFLGNARTTQPTMVPTGSAGRTTVVAAVGPPQPNALGPNGGIITAVQDVTQAYAGTFNGSTLSGQALPFYQASSPSTGGISVITGVAAPASAYPAGILTPLGIPSAQAASTQVMFRAFSVTETVTSYSASSQDLPFEEYIRPGWYGSVWQSGSIGQAYQQFFGTAAITDQTNVNAGSSSATNPNLGQQQAIQQASTASSADDPQGQALGILQLQSGSSVEQACAFLVMLYSTVRQSNADVEAFISAYTGRPIASLVDLFGSANLALSSDGTSVVQGVEGFHSRAFGPYANLFGLVTPQVASVVGIQRDTPAAQRSDTRGRKQAAITAYVQQLQFARAILG